jgi:hypothetical protein
VIREEILALVELEKSVTPNWIACGSERGGCVCLQIHGGVDHARAPILVGLTSKDEEYTCGEGFTQEQGKVNVQFATRLRNAAPALLARILELEDILTPPCGKRGHVSSAIGIEDLHGKTFFCQTCAYEDRIAKLEEREQEAMRIMRNTSYYFSRHRHYERGEEQYQNIMAFLTAGEGKVEG